MLTNTYVGMREVDADVKDAARGMGMTGGQLLRRVELPLAVPLIFGRPPAPRRSRWSPPRPSPRSWPAAASGRYIVDGFAHAGLRPCCTAGSVLVAVLCLVIELVPPGGAAPASTRVEGRDVHAMPARRGAHRELAERRPPEDARVTTS